MTTTYDPQFIDSFLDIWSYIAKDSSAAASVFRRQPEAKIESISNFPYKARKSLYHDDENIRDYIFKGYTIPYIIDKQNNQIVILDIFKWVDR